MCSVRKIVMSCGLYYAVSGFRCQEMELEILSHNLANVNTVGYKDDKPSFRGIYPEITRSMTIETPDDLRRFMLNRKMNMSYPGLSHVKVDYSNGQMRRTGNQLDAALIGPGFFAVDTPQGELYTRMGNFSLNEKKELVIHEGGYPLKRKAKEKETGKEGDEHIRIEGTEISIDQDGGISVDGNQGDSLKVVDFAEYAQLRKVGDNLYENRGGKENELAAEGCEVSQYHTELSNVNIVQKMIKMINVARVCESYQKVIQSLDEIDTRATRDVGAVA
jgi:flagellar basal-body rod protein FlgG